MGGFQVTLDELHPALAAGTVAAAGGIDGHICPAGNFQQVITGAAFYGYFGGTFNLKNDFWHKKIPAFSHDIMKTV